MRWKDQLGRLSTARVMRLLLTFPRVPYREPTGIKLSRKSEKICLLHGVVLLWMSRMPI